MELTLPNPDSPYRNTMDPLATWEKLTIGVIGLLVLLWFSPGVKIMIGQSRDAKKLACRTHPRSSVCHFHYAFT